jgi:Cdc6-like AAA superfamily ATPase
MKEDPFYVGEIPEDKIEALFVNRSSELTYAMNMIGKRMKMCIPILGDTGTGKSSMLNVIAALGKKSGLKVFKISVEDYDKEETRKQIEDTELILVDNINRVDNTTAISIYQKITENVNAGKRIFFCDLTKREFKARKERDYAVTHKPIILSTLKTAELKRWLQERMQRCDYSYNFTDEAIELVAKRSKGNLRDFFRYCGMAYAYGTSTITFKDMERAILDIDSHIIFSLDDLSRFILKVIYATRGINTGELFNQIKENGRWKNTSGRLFYKNLDELIEHGLVVSERFGHEVTYSLIYAKIGMNVNSDYFQLD